MESPLAEVDSTGKSLALRYGAAARGEGEGWLEVAVPDPSDLGAADDLTFALGRDVRLVAAEVGPEGVPPGAAIAPAGSPAPGSAPAELTAADLKVQAGQAPVVAWVGALLTRAVRDGASDLHFEPFADEFRVRGRVDGVLAAWPPPPRELALPVISRLKVLADLDIAERRLPQDGRLRLEVAGRSVDLRVSTLPTSFGESVVLRVLDPAVARHDLEDLGLPADVRAGLSEAIRRPHGLVLVTGPTGAGKTTTLYAALRALNTTDIKILTVEDPVEYELDGLMQVAVQPTAGLGFAPALRAFLRQDPDVIMVGEIRDPETARTAVQAALTGHLVLSTLHTNDAPGAAERLIDLGVEPYLVAAAVEGVLAQRLVRLICPECRAPAEAGPAVMAELGWPRVEGKGPQTFVGRGCALCEGRGYRGRRGVFEWMPVSSQWRDLVGSGATGAELRRYAAERGQRTLRDEARRLVAAGETTAEEAARCCSE